MWMYMYRAIFKKSWLELKINGFGLLVLRIMLFKKTVVVLRRKGAKE